MIDFGPIPRGVLAGVNAACEHADAYISRIKETAWVDNIPVDDLPLWERFLNIYAENLDDASRRALILAYFGATGCARVSWFYELAARLGYQRGHYNKYGVWNVNGGTWDADTAAVYFVDGEFLPFRVGISLTGDKVYDNIDYGATTCRCFYRNASDPASDMSLQLKDLIEVARSLGTKILFVDTRVESNVFPLTD